MGTIVIKRDGREEAFNEFKIVNAILKAMKYGAGKVNKEVAQEIAQEIYKKIRGTKTKISSIEKEVYIRLLDKGCWDVAKAYEGYRAVQEFKRKNNSTDESIMSLLRDVNEEVSKENSNKNAKVASTQRDLIAGEVSKDVARRKLIPAEIVQAHDEGAIHYHDLDYAIQSIFNCCLVNVEDMLQNGTVINDKLVEKPKSFETACTVVTQIMAQVASNQYGGQSITIRHLAPFLRISYEKHLKHYKKHLGDEMAENLAKERMKQELRNGVQTIRYQLSTLQTTNGQFGCL